MQLVIYNTAAAVHVDEDGNETEPKQLPVGRVLKMECFGEGVLLATETDQETGDLPSYR